MGRLLARSAFASALLAASMCHPQPWRFGIIADTQWPANLPTDSLSGFRNPNGVAVDLLRQIDRQFIARQVSFVLAVGDLTDDASLKGIDTRATWAQPLYDDGIGFFPLRGNHDGLATTATRFLHDFPQTRDGWHNRTPLDAFDWTDSATLHPNFALGARVPFSRGAGFSSPSPSLAGLSYAFSHENATFVLLDQFTPPDESANSIQSQLDWIDSSLANRPAASHAFVLGHKGIVAPSHPDNLFATTPDQDSASSHRFLRSLSRNGVHLYFGGHDHIQDRSLVSITDDPAAKLQTVALGSASYKFYAPLSIPMDTLYDLANRARLSRKPLSQELDRFAYTIVTVDGPKVEVETWSAPSGQQGGTVSSVPDLTGQWSLRERYGYSLNGREFLIPQGAGYLGVRDSAQGTRMRILGGTNTCTAKEYAGTPLLQAVNTGWSRSTDAFSATLSLWGMECEMGSFATPHFTLSLSLDPGTPIEEALTGRISLGRLEDSTWFRAAGNDSTTLVPRIRSWQETDPIGTWGVDTATRSLWAVLDRGGNLALRPADALAASITSQKTMPLPSMHGRILRLSTPYSGLPVTIDLMSLDGRLLGHLVTRHPQVQLPDPGTSIALVRIQAPGLRPVVLKYLHPR